MCASERKRVLIVSNSQGTAAGLADDDILSSYPHLLRSRFPELEFHFWNRSYLSVIEVDQAYREIILQHQPDIVVLQLGIIECGSRILPPRVRDFFRIVPFGGRITKLLHDQQRQWRRFLRRLNLYFVDFPEEVYRTSLKSLFTKLKSSQVKVLCLAIPELSEQCNDEFLFDNNKQIAHYNCLTEEASAELGVKMLRVFDNCDDKTRNSLYLKDSVHFSKKGHRLVSDTIAPFLDGLW